MQKNSKISFKSKRNSIWVFALIILVMIGLIFKLAYIQIINHDEYANLALEQQMQDTVVEAKRGVIYDRNGKELATSVTCYTLYARPEILAENYSTEEMKGFAASVSTIIGLEESEILEKFNASYSYSTITKFLDKEQATQIRALKVTGLELAEATRRYYPLGTLASQLLGSVTDENSGRSGLELQYDQYLAGVDGRWVKSADINGNELVDGTYEYYEAQDGLNVVTTIDEAVQYYVEKALNEALETTQANKIECLVMKPKTGEILASASTGGFDPNNALKPANEDDLEAFVQMTEKEQVDYLSEMWRNPLVSDVYEPGSTFKLVTASAALEENAITLTDTFTCGKSILVSGIRLHCWSPVDHGKQTIKQAIGNSCNPVMVKVAQLLGKEKLYKYIKLYGITELTGIDYPGEAGSIVYDLSQVGPVELATNSYGHGIAVTPIQLLTAVNSIANEGVLMKPHYVKALTDSNGNVVEEYDPVIVRQVISKETADTMKEIMEYVVSDAGGKSAKIAGYRIGGKTGTANKIDVGSGAYYEDSYCSSFIGIAPIDDPEISILVMVDSPKGSYYGSTVAAPIAKTILEEILRYLDIKPEYTEKEIEKIEKNYTEVPNLIGMTFAEAKEALEEKKLTYDKPSNTPETDDWIVVSQYPKEGEKVAKGSSIYLYEE